MTFQRFVRGAALWATIAFTIVCPTGALATQLMPAGQQQFLSATGVPLSGGFVYMYTPNTAICKGTWKDSAQATPNACPIVLDSSGSALIYGAGCYTQVVQDSLGNQIYSQLTCEPGSSGAGSAGPIVWGGTASALGTPNAIQLPNATAFTAVDGQVVSFIPIATNTGATTATVGGQSTLPIVKDTTGGPVALSGGEITFSGTGNIVSMEFSATQGNFHLLNTAIATTSTGSAAPLCGATGLKVLVASTTNVTVTARNLVTQNAVGQILSRSNVTLTLNTSLGNSSTAAGGMDGEVPGTSAWIDVFAIDNGAAPNALGSLAAGRGLGPTLPSGYAYSCYLGAVRVDGSGNLLKTIQFGPQAQYLTTSVGLPLIASTTGTPAAFGSAWTGQLVAAFVPPTAVRIVLQLQVSGTVTSAQTYDVNVAPSNTYATVAGTSPFPLCNVGSSTSNTNGTVTRSNILCEFVLEGTSIYTGLVNTGTVAANLSTLGWIDSVNAN
jgi:hypothetical protein